MKYLILILLLASKSFAIDLQIKPRNSDKKNYNATPSVNIDVGTTFFTELGIVSNPLISKGVVTGKTYSLIDTLVEAQTGLSYGYSENVQFGILVPLQYLMDDSSKFILGSTLIEGKIKLNKYFAIMPGYLFANEQNFVVNNGGTKETLSLGNPSGGYGAKLVAEISSLDTSNYGLAGYLGYYSFPDNIYRNIDQSSKLQWGISSGVPLNNNFNFIAELYGEKTPSSNPLELQGLIQYKTPEVNYQIGIGTGDLQDVGSNTFKGFVGLQYAFGSSKKATPSKSIYDSYKIRNPTQPTRKSPVIELPIPKNRENNTSLKIQVRSIASIRSPASFEVKTLPNGEKVKVFDGKIDGLPSKGMRSFDKIGYQAEVQKIIKQQNDLESDPKNMIEENVVQTKETPAEQITEVKKVEETPVENQETVETVVETKKEMEPLVETTPKSIELSDGKEELVTSQISVEEKRQEDLKKQIEKEFSNFSLDEIKKMQVSEESQALDEEINKIRAKENQKKVEIENANQKMETAKQRELTKRESPLEENSEMMKSNQELDEPLIEVDGIEYSSGPDF